MRCDVVIFSYDANKVSDKEVELYEQCEHSEPVEVARRNDEEPHACGETQKGKDADNIQRNAICMKVGGFFFIRRW